VALLQQRGTAVALVSGGFRQIIEPIAESLDVPKSHVHANRLLFNDDGSYAGADSPLHSSTLYPRCCIQVWVHAHQCTAEEAVV
jgi:phosphoserine phosphatase